MNENYLTNVGIESSYSPFYDDHQQFQSLPPPSIDPWSINAGNANQFVDEQGQGNYSGELIGPGVPGAGGSPFEAKVEALYQIYGPEMANAALQQDISLAMLDQADQLIDEMKKEGILNEDDANLMHEHVQLARDDVTKMPVTDAAGNILFEDLNGNGRLDEGLESPLKVDPQAKDDVDRWLGNDINALAGAVGQQWAQELSDGDGGLFGGVLELPNEELAAIGRGETDNIGESGQDYGDNITVNNHYYADPVTPDDVAEETEALEQVERNGEADAGEDGEVTLEDILHAVEDVQDEMRKDGRGGTNNNVGNEGNGGGGGGDAEGTGDSGGSSAEGTDSGGSSAEGTEGGGGGGSEGINGGGETSSMATNNWLVILASAMGKTSGKHLKAMLDTGKELGSIDSKENPEVFAQLNAEFSAESQIFKMFQEAISTSVKSIGEGMSSVARKS